MSKKIAIMQPYIFPYIGYWQLINAVDIFVIYDDVTYIKGGYINRNFIYNNGQPLRFNVFLKKPSSNKKIKEIEVNYDLKWKELLLKQIKQSYNNAPFFDKIFTLIENILNTEYQNISSLIFASISEIKDYLGLTTKIVETSAIYNNSELNKFERVIDICKKENASLYINPIGGTDLYDKIKFQKKNISLKFLEPKNILYKQFDKEFTPNLSIIDVMMFNSKNEIKKMLTDYKLI